MDGVGAVVVDLEAGRATVQGQGFSGEAARAAIDELGYVAVGGDRLAPSHAGRAAVRGRARGELVRIL